MSRNFGNYSGTMVDDGFGEVPIETFLPLSPERDFIDGRSVCADAIKSEIAQNAETVLKIFCEIEAQVQFFVKKNSLYIQDFQEVQRFVHFTFTLHSIPIVLRIGKGFSWFSLNGQDIARKDFAATVYTYILMQALGLNEDILSYHISLPQRVVEFFGAKKGHMGIFYEKGKNTWTISIVYETKTGEKKNVYMEFAAFLEKFRVDIGK